MIDPNFRVLVFDVIFPRWKRRLEWKTKQTTELKQKNLHHMTRSGIGYLSQGPASLELKINKGLGG